jgi:hypothetical protein
MPAAAAKQIGNECMLVTDRWWHSSIVFCTLLSQPERADLRGAHGARSVTDSKTYRASKQARGVTSHTQQGGTGLQRTASLSATVFELGVSTHLCVSGRSGCSKTTPVLSSYAACGQRAAVGSCVQRKVLGVVSLQKFGSDLHLTASNRPGECQAAGRGR